MNSRIQQHKKKRLAGQRQPDLSLGCIEVTSMRRGLFERSSVTGVEGGSQPNRSSNTIAAEAEADWTKQPKPPYPAKLLSPRRAKDCSTETGFASAKQRTVLKKTAQMSGVFVAGSRINSPSEASHRFQPTLATSLAGHKALKGPASHGVASAHFPKVSATRTLAKASQPSMPSSLARQSSRGQPVPATDAGPSVDR